MESKSYSFSAFNNYTEQGIAEALLNCNTQNKKPIYVCIGSDLVLGDSLGPLVGTMLKQKCENLYVYGTLTQPITAKEVEYAKTYLKQMHPNSLLVAVDAAVGNENDVGLIKVANKGLKPGLGVNKNLSTIGDVSIIGIVCGKSLKNYNLYNLTRLSLVYKMTEQIVGGIKEYSKILDEKFMRENKNIGIGAI